MANKEIGERRLIEMRAIENTDDSMVIEGYAIIWDVPATHVIGDWRFTEVIRKDALVGAIMTDVPLRYNHNDSWMIIARTRNKSLELIIDDKGLKIRATLIDTQSNRDIYKSIKSGLIDKMSFAFTVRKNGAKTTYTDDGEYREVTAIERLYDVSVVDEPFYDSTSVFARSKEIIQQELMSGDFAIRKRRLAIKAKYI